MGRTNKRTREDRATQLMDTGRVSFANWVVLAAMLIMSVIIVITHWLVIADDE